MNIEQLSNEIFIKYGDLSKTQLKHLLFEEYNKNNPELTEKVFNRVKNIAANIGKIIQKFGKVATTVIKKLGSSVIQFVGGMWKKGYTTPDGRFLVGVLNKKIPTVVLGNTKNSTNEALTFLQKCNIELNEVNAAEYEKQQKGFTTAEITPEIRRLDMMAGEAEAQENINNPRIGMDIFKSEILPEYLKAGEARTDPDQPIPSFMIIGAAGTAKTTVIKSLEALGWTVCTMELSRTSETALTGIPADVINPETGKKETTYLPLSILPKKEKSILFFDEFNQASADLLPAVMNLIHKGEIPESKYVCPTKVVIVLAGNAGDKEIDSISVKSVIDQTLYGRISEILILESSQISSYSGKKKVLTKTGFKNVPDVKDTQVLWPSVDETKEEIQKLYKEKKLDNEIEKKLGAKTEGAAVTTEDDLSVKSPFDDTLYTFHMGELPVILKNWVAHREAGETGSFENSEFYNQVKSGGYKKPTTGKGFNLIVKAPELGPLADGANDNELIHEVSIRDIWKWAYAMKRSALNDFMNVYLFDPKYSNKIKFPAGLVAKKKMSDYINEWKEAGYQSAPGYYLALNQEYYLQKKATVLPTKRKEDQDPVVKDILHFYKKVKETGRVLDLPTGVCFYSTFTKKQLNDLEFASKSANSNAEGQDKSEKNKFLKIIDIRTHFAELIGDFFGRVKSLNGLREEAKKLLEMMETNISDIDNVMDVEKAKKAIAAKDDEFIDYIVHNIKTIIDVFEISANELEDLRHKYHKNDSWEADIISTLRVTSKTFGNSESAHYQSGISGTGDEELVFEKEMEQLFGDKDKKEPPKKRGRKPKDENMEMPKFLLKLFEEIK